MMMMSSYHRYCLCIDGGSIWARMSAYSGGIAIDSTWTGDEWAISDESTMWIASSR